MKKEGKRKLENKNKKENKDIPKKQIIIISTIIILLLICIFFAFRNASLTPKVIQNILTPNVIENPPTPVNCSNESIKKVWEFIFKGSSENLTIVKTPYNYSNISEDESEIWNTFFKGGCPIYNAYRINGTNVKMIFGTDIWFLMDMKGIVAINAEYTPEMITNITKKLNEEYSGENETFIMAEFLEEGTVLRNINTTEQAKAQFESIFKISSSNWTKEEGVDFEGAEVTTFSFSENKTFENITIFGESIDPMKEIVKGGLIFQNYSMDMYTYIDVSFLSSIEELEKKFGNWNSPINTSLKNITVEINNSKLKISDELDILSESRSGVQKVELLENNQTIVETEINFTQDNGFDWTKVILKKQNINSTQGYVIINGLNYTKNVTLDRLNNESESVCIKDKEINFISEVSEDCGEIDEYIINCPGNLSNSVGNLTCKISGNKFIITGLRHSAILEIIPEEEPCIQNWVCGDWTEYNKECGYRTCNDANNCSNISGKPLEQQECPQCTPNWECTSFYPEKCPKEEERTRSCIDLNECNSDEGKPELNETCERKSILIYVLIGGLILAVMVLAIIIIRRIIKKKEKLGEHPKTEQKHYRNEPNYPSPVEQYYGSDQTHNFKAPQRANTNTANEDNIQERFPEKYWPK